MKRLEIEAIKERVERPDLIRVRTRILVHDRGGDGITKCPCCGSVWAVITREIDDLDLLIDTEEGTRDLRHEQADPELYDAIAAEADITLDVPLRCSEIGLRLLLSEARTTVAQGGSRSSKTQHGVVGGFRWWMLHGGPAAEAIFIGPELRHAHLLLQKWAIGEGDSPPVCPPELIVSYPEKLRQEDQTIRMIDGTVIHLMHAKGDGKNIAGVSAAWVNATELALIKDERNWAQCRTRVMTTGGPIYADAVPEAGSWVKRGIIDPARAEEETRGMAERAGKDPGPREWLALQLEAEDNPWNAPGEGEKATEVLAATDPRMASRFGKGDWVGKSNKAFGELLADRHRYEYEGYDCERIGLLDITKAAVASYFMRGADWLIGVDVNAHPHSALIGKIGVSPKDVEGLAPALYSRIPRDRWVFVFVDFVQFWGKDSIAAAEQLSTMDRGRYKGAAVIMDATACYKGHNSGGGLNKNIIPRRAFEDAGFMVRPPDHWPDSGKPKAPGRSDSALTVRRLLSVGAEPPGPPAVMFNAVRCAKVIEALRDHDAEPDGVTPVRSSNTYADRHIIAATDALRYVVWPFARLDKMNTGQVAVRWN